MSFSTIKTRKIQDTSLTIVMSIPDTASIIVSCKVGEAYVPMQTYTANETITLKGKGLQVQVEPTGGAEFELLS